MKLPLAIVSSVLLVGCLDQKALVQRFVPKEDDDFARRFIDRIRDKQYAEAEAMLDESIRAQASSKLWKLHVIVDHGQAVAFDTIASFVGFFKPWNGPAKRQVSLAYQIQFPDAWVVADIVVESSGQERRIKTANFQPISDSLQVLNAFTFKNKSIIHFLFFVACILIPIFMIVTIVLCVRSRVRRRWLWISFIVIGLVQFQLNWSTGAWTIQPISFSLLGAAYFRPGLYGPWTLKFAIPIGAIIFLTCPIS